MRAEFIDRQDKSNPYNGILISEPQKLCTLIDEVRTKPPFFCELVGENGFNLLLGLSDSLGCAQFSASDGAPPYLMATCDSIDVRDDEFREFLSGNTDTPVPLRFCLPMEIIKKIAVGFVVNGDRSADVSWEEI